MLIFFSLLRSQCILYALIIAAGAGEVSGASKQCARARRVCSSNE